MKNIYLYCFCLCLAAGCIPPPDEEIITKVSVDIQDDLFRHIADLQDRQAVDSLYAFLRHKDPTYRLLAARAFSSIQDPQTLDSLALLLQDEVPGVRAAAAHAIGQLREPKSEARLLAAFDQTDTVGFYHRANQMILEAVGKCGSAAALKAMSTISTYQPRDTALLLGQVHGIYQYGLREIISPESQARMTDIATNADMPTQVRQVAAGYLARMPLPSIAADSSRLAAAFKQEQDIYVRMSLASALGRTQSGLAAAALIDRYHTEPDYRVKCSILRAFGNLPYEQVQPTAISSLKASNPHVAKAAAEFFLAHGSSQEATTYWRMAKDSFPTVVQLTLYAASNRHLGGAGLAYRDAITGELRRRFARVVSPHNKVAVLSALAEFPWNFRFIHREGMAHPSPVVHSGTIQVLASISNRKDFDSFFGGSARGVLREMGFFFRKAIESGDVGMICEAAIALRNPDRKYASIYKDSTAFLGEALDKLQLPRDFEAWKELTETRDFLLKKPKAIVPPPAYNHPINWALIDGLKDKPLVDITTDKGIITLQLLPDLAPGSVANFVKLAADGFFDGKTFHRVVTNFVVQGGCPRGDGYGSSDHSIRSEVPAAYYDDAGYVGMASAGLHTEGTQFFITHAPTPHLNGRYTIFAKVTQGMDVVHQLQINDKMTRVQMK